MPDSDPVQVADYLWQEYAYRHDLVWKLVFRVTAVATALLIAPFLADKEVRDAVGHWLLGLPALAIVVLLVGYFVLLSELELLHKIRSAYRQVQDQALRHLEPPWEEHGTQPEWAKGHLWRHQWQQRFEGRVSSFMLLLLAAAVAFSALFWFKWLPDL